MRLVFEKIEIKNFMSFSEETFEFNKFKGMIRIKGKNHDIPNQLNGSGKSNLSNALVYGLFGELPFKLKNENVNNRYINDKNTSVRVFFKVDKKKYEIVSGLRGRQSYCDLYEVSKGGELKDISRSSIAETRKYLENEILHCDMNLFMRTIYLNSDENFNFYKLKQADRKEFIDKLFDISIFGDIYNLIHKDKIRMDKEIVVIQNRLMVLNNASDDYAIKSESFEKNKIEKIKNLEEKFSVSKQDFENKKSNVTERNTELINKCNEKIDKLETEINKLNSINQKLNISISESNQTIKRLNSSISDRQKIINKHSELHSKLCNDCKDIFAKYHNLDTFKKEIEKMNSKIEEENIKKTEKTNEYNENASLIKTHNETLTKLSKHLRKLNSDYENEQKELRNMELLINSLETQLENVKNQENPYIELSRDNEKNIESETTKLVELTNSHKYIEFSESIVSQDNLKKFIIKDLVGLLNNKIKHYLHKLGTNCDVIFDEEMKYDFITPSKSGVEFNNFSAGEQARISIATCFAFRDFLSTRSNISSNIFILDEFFDSNVDPLAIEHTMEILNGFIKNYNQKIFIVSHRSEIGDDVFDDIILIEKKNNISKIN